MLRSALILVDLQNDFCHPEGFFAQRLGVSPTLAVDKLVVHVNELTAAVRAGGGPVIWLRNVWRNDQDVGLLLDRRPMLKTGGCREGTWGAQLLEDLDVRPSDVVIAKRRFSGFFGTSLDEELKSASVESLIIGGIRTEHCVESTVRDAFYRDYRVFVVEDAVASHVLEFHEASLNVMGDLFAHIVSRAAVLQGLEDDSVLGDELVERRSTKRRRPVAQMDQEAAGSNE